MLSYFFVYLLVLLTYVWFLLPGFVSPGCKWRADGKQNELTCPSLPATFGPERCFYEGKQVKSLKIQILKQQVLGLLVCDLFYFFLKRYF